MKTEKKAKISTPKPMSSMDLVTATAHDMKTPLVLLNGLAERLLNEKLSEGQKKQYLERINISTTRLLQLVESLAAAKISTSRSNQSNVQPCNLSSVIEQVVEEQALHAEHRFQKLVFNPKPMIVLTSRVALYRILSNLVDNAIKYSSPNSEIVIKVGRRDKFCVISVRDSGPGFRKDDLVRVFSAFGVAMEPTNALPGSSGMGLYISRHLADSIGGELNVTPIKGGSVFSLKIPLSDQLSLF